MTSVSTQEVLTEAVSSDRSGSLYDSDAFESTFGSETCTSDRPSDSHTNPTSPLHSSSSFITLTDTLINEDNTYEERVSPSHTDPAVEQCSSAAEIFATQKLKLLRAKLTPLTETDASSDSDAVVRAPVQTDTSSQCSKIAERAFTEACLGRLNTSVAECPARVNQSSTVVGTTRPFAAQYERLKMESLQHTMEKQIKSLAGEVEECYPQGFTCAECRNQQRDEAEKEFVCQKVKLLTQTEFREKLDKHLYQMDSLSLLGDIVGSCMRPSAPDGDVWKAMADKMAQLKRETLEN